MDSKLTCDPEDYSIKIRDAAGVMVAQVHQYSKGAGPSRADCEVYARLFAAAPDLLAALQDCVALIRGDISGTMQRSGVLQEAADAIAKATS